MISIEQLAAMEKESFVKDVLMGLKRSNGGKELPDEKMAEELLQEMWAEARRDKAQFFALLVVYWSIAEGILAEHIADELGIAEKEEVQLGINREYYMLKYDGCIGVSIVSDTFAKFYNDVLDNNDVLNIMFRESLTDPDRLEQYATSGTASISDEVRLGMFKLADAWYLISGKDKKVSEDVANYLRKNGSPCKSHGDIVPNTIVSGEVKTALGALEEMSTVVNDKDNSSFMDWINNEVGAPDKMAWNAMFDVICQLISEGEVLVNEYVRDAKDYWFEVSKDVQKYIYKRMLAASYFDTGEWTLFMRGSIKPVVYELIRLLLYPKLSVNVWVRELLKYDRIRKDFPILHKYILKYGGVGIQLYRVVAAMLASTNKDDNREAGKLLKFFEA